jgi:hypothetical protein
MLDSQREILELKIQRKTNVEIAEIINKKHGKKYNDNYISTIYRQKVIPKICATANLHLTIVENLFFPENFKSCTWCGKTLMRDGAFFTKKKGAPDGFVARCKICEKLSRQLGGLSKENKE